MDEAALQLHKKRIHLATSVADYLRTDKTYTCDLCKKTFYYVVNLKKHHWLIHQRPKKPVEVIKSIGPLDPRTIRSVSRAIASLSYIDLCIFEYITLTRLFCRNESKRSGKT